MQFVKGQVLVHPHHGPVTVTGIMARKVAGEKRQYLGLAVVGADLEIAVPLETVEEVGIRPVIGVEQLQELFDTLAGPSEPEEKAWSRRFKRNRDRLRLGDLAATAGVARDLARRLAEHGLSAGEKEMLREARRPIIGEISVALDLDEEAVEALIDQAVDGEDVQVAALTATALAAAAS